MRLNLVRLLSFALNVAPLTSCIEHLQTAWRSAVYTFFKRNIKIGFDNGRKYHFFICAARKCKGSGGIRRYQDSKDRAATSNLKTHALKCFGAAAVDAAFKKTTPLTQDGSLFSAFAHQGQRPATVTHRAHNVDESRAHIVRWCAESNRPPHIVCDREFSILMKAGRPTTALPSATTVMRDIKLSFDICRTNIDNILKNHSGQVHFATDAWTSTNHRAYVAWTIHLHHQGSILTFALDMMELPEVRGIFLLITLY
ncbi:hypothetical protein BD779DRAFT_1450826 [Infundibulicybe gibba]|nr:hypothetical protein BD779DRAFT_1450826 [Infundibulicybe gibba]